MFHQSFLQNSRKNVFEIFRMLFPDLLKSRSKWEKQLFRDYKEMLDYNFSYLQEVIAVFQQYKEVARCKGWGVKIENISISRTNSNGTQREERFLRILATNLLYMFHKNLFQRTRYVRQNSNAFSCNRELNISNCSRFKSNSGLSRSATLPNRGHVRSKFE